VDFGNGALWKSFVQNMLNACTETIRKHKNNITILKTIAEFCIIILVSSKVDSAANGQVWLWKNGVSCYKVALMLLYFSLKLAF
jgi:hypothetical protein